MRDANNNKTGNETMYVTHTTTEIRFKFDKNGKRFAQVWSWECFCWVRMGLEKAELMVATGQAEESDSKW